MRTWEYKILDSNDVPGGGFLRGKSRESVETYLNRLGAEGWEVVNIGSRELEGRTSFVGIAKREMS